MISLIPQEDIILNWPAISEALAEFWDVSLNYETLPNLKRRLLAEDCRLWLWQSEEARLLFISEDRYTAKGCIFTVTHTAGYNKTGSRWTPRQLKATIGQVFSEIEELAEATGHVAICIHARPGHVRLADGYRVWNTPIIKEFKEK